MADIYPYLITNTLLTLTNLTLVSNSLTTATFNINNSNVGSTYTTNIGILANALSSTSAPTSNIIIGRNLATTGTTPLTQIYIGDNQSTISAASTYTSIGQNSSTGSSSTTITEIGQQSSTVGSTLVRIGSMVNSGTANIFIGSIYASSANVSGSTNTTIGLIDGSSTSQSVIGTTTNIIGQLKQVQTSSNIVNYIGHIVGSNTKSNISGTVTNYLGYVDQYVTASTITNNIGNIYITSNSTVTTNIGTASGNGTNNIIIGNNNSGTNNLIIQSPIVQIKGGTNVVRAYIPSRSGNVINIINTTTNTITGSINGVSNSIFALAINPNGQTMYVTDEYNTIYVINLLTNVISSTIVVGSGGFRGITILPNGNSVYACNFNSSNVSVINTTTNTIVATISSLGNPNCIVANSNSTRVYIASYNGNIYVINTSTNTVIATISHQSSVYEIVINNDNTRLYTITESGFLTVINAITNTVITTLNVGGGRNLDITPDGTKLYCSTSSTRISVISTLTNTVIATITIANNGSGFGGIGVTPDGLTVYAFSNQSNIVNIISTTTNTVTSTLAISAPTAFGKFIARIPTTSSVMRFYDRTVNSTSYVGLKAPDSGISSYTITLPPTIAIRNNQVWASSTTGIGSWVDAAINNGNTLGGPLTLGTNDANQVILRTNGTNHLTIGTTGDITLATVPVRLITTGSPELCLEQTGDIAGATRLRIMNRGSYNGIIVQNMAVDNVDIGFLPSSGVQHSIRFSHSSTLIGNSSGEFQFGDLSLGTFYFRIGTGLTQLPTSVLSFGNRTQNKLISLWDGGTVSDGNAQNYYGFGINSGTLRYQVDSTTSQHSFYAATSSTTSNLLFNIGGNGTITIPSTGFLDNAGELRSGNVRTRSYTLAVPTNIGGAIQFAYWNFTHGSANLDIMITVQNSGFSVSKRYILPIAYNHTGSVWRKVYPFSSTNSTPNNDLDLNLYGSAANCYLRIIRTVGSTTGTAYITLLQNGTVFDGYDGNPSYYNDTVPTTLVANANSGMFNNIFYTESISSSATVTANTIITSNSITSTTAQSNTSNILNGGPLNMYNSNNTAICAIRASPSLSSSYTMYLPPSIGTSGQVLTTDGSGNSYWSTLPPSSSAYYGDGSNGDYTVQSGGITITQDMFYNNLTMNDVMGTNGFKVFVRGTLTVNVGCWFGVFGSPDGPSTGSGTLGNGASGGYNSNGQDVYNSLGGNGGQGGYGTYIAGKAYPPSDAEGGLAFAGSPFVTGRSKSYALYRGGAGAGAHSGGGQFIHGGNGGGIVLVAAKKIVINSGGSIGFLAYGTGGWNGGGGGGGGAAIVMSSSNVISESNFAIGGGSAGNQSGSQAGSNGRWFFILA